MIRFGTYTLYKNYYFRLIEKSDFYRIVYDGPNCPFYEFLEYAKNVYYKDLPKEEISNAFFVKTKCIYRGFQFDISGVTNDIFHLSTDDKIAYNELNLYFLDRSVYTIDVKKQELERLWEEYTSSELGLPMPKEVGLIKDIKINRERNG